ncbi:MAG TPA: amidohydrolase [Bryobacteraceae bacterium]|nr:amidohydrolase [Bryobacteraceae bacterium]
MRRISPDLQMQTTILSLFALLGGVAAAQATDAVYWNGKIITVDPRFSTAEAIAIRGGRFTAVGKNEDIRRLAGTATRVVDLHGKTVVPGLEDSHLHGAGGGPGVDLSDTRSLADVYARIRERVQHSKPGDVIVSNSDWHEAQLKEQRLPLRRDLDPVSPENPVVLVRGGHEFILNSAALAKWHIEKATASPEGGQISRYPDGEPNGELIDRARTLVALPQNRLTPDQQIESWSRQFRKLHAAGLTSIRQPGISLDQYHLFQEMKRRGLLTMRITALLSAPPNPDAAKVRAFLENSGVRPDEGDEWLKIGGMKLIVDGGFEGGWMREPYQEPYGKDGTFRGLNLMPRERYTEIVKELNRLGWRVGTHAVGDAAIDEVLAAYEAANREKPIQGKRWAIEHGFLPREEHFARIKALGAFVTVQNHLYLAGPSLVHYWGAARAARVTPVRAYLDHGVDVAAGTDAPVVPFPPLWTMYHFVTRGTISGGVLGPDQKITREEALRIATIGNARLTFDEQIKGSIEPGKLADFVVLDEDILTADPKRIEQMKILMTVVGGNAVFTR